MTNNVGGFEEGVFPLLPRPPHGALTEVQLLIVLPTLQTAGNPGLTDIPEGGLQSGALWSLYNVQTINSHGKTGKWIFCRSCHLKNKVWFSWTFLRNKEAKETLLVFLLLHSCNVQGT